MELYCQNHCFFRLLIVVTFARLSCGYQFQRIEATITNAEGPCAKFVLEKSVLDVRLTIVIHRGDETKDFTLFVVYKNKGQPEELCIIQNISTCPKSTSEGCNCTEIIKDKFDFIYQGPAKQKYIGAQLSVNDHIGLTGSTLQVNSYDDIKFEWKLDDAARETFYLDTACPSIDKNKIKEKSHIKFCAWGLREPELELARKGHLNKNVDNEECLSMSIDRHSELIEFRFSDKCERKGSFKCPVGIYTKDINLPESPQEPDDEQERSPKTDQKSPTASTSYFVPLLVGLVVTTIILFGLFYGISRLVQTRTTVPPMSLAEG